MNKPNPTKKQKKEISDSVFKLLAIMDNNLPEFLKSLPYDKKTVSSMEEDKLTEELVRFFLNKVHIEGFLFMSQPIQKGRRKVDIGVFLAGNNSEYIFCIEAKFLRLRHSSFDYVTGEYAAIKRFKAKEHGLNNSIEKVPLPQNGIVAYVKSGTFKDHFIKINEKIKKLSENHSHKQDEFGSTWNKSEQLEKIYFKSIAKLFSIHPRPKTTDVSLYHFWIYTARPK